MSISVLTRGYNKPLRRKPTRKRADSSSRPRPRHQAAVLIVNDARVAVYGLAYGRQRAVMTGWRGAVRCLIAGLIPWPTAQEFEPRSLRNVVNSAATNAIPARKSAFFPIWRADAPSLRLQLFRGLRAEGSCTR